jgi:hypothetical protein
VSHVRLNYVKIQWRIAGVTCEIKLRESSVRIAGVTCEIKVRENSVEDSRCHI